MKMPKEELLNGGKEFYEKKGALYVLEAVRDFVASEKDLFQRALFIIYKSCLKIMYDHIDVFFKIEGKSVVEAFYYKANEVDFLRQFYVARKTLPSCDTF